MTQSTVSARIQRLEDERGTRLFVRNRAGASLTPAGRRFFGLTKRLVPTADQARDDVGLPERYRASIRIGVRVRPARCSRSGPATSIRVSLSILSH